jgi:hypothetical protein
MKKYSFNIFEKDIKSNSMKRHNQSIHYQSMRLSMEQDSVNLQLIRNARSSENAENKHCLFNVQWDDGRTERDVDPDTGVVLLLFDNSQIGNILLDRYSMSLFGAIKMKFRILANLDVTKSYTMCRMELIMNGEVVSG